MMGTALLALAGSLWVERFGGNVLRSSPAPRAEEAPPARAV
jgi:hypothetical protein